MTVEITYTRGSIIVDEYNYTYTAYNEREALFFISSMINGGANITKMEVM